MTIDERLEKLVGRHEVLAQTVVERLAHIAEIHERRLDGLEGER